MNPIVIDSLPLISLVVIGFGLKKIGLINRNDGPHLSAFILNITLPAVIFLSVSQADVDPVKLVILAMCSFTISLILRLLSGRITQWLKIPASIAGVIILSSMAMNIGNFLFPITQTIYGSEGVSRLAAFDIGNSLMASGYGYYLATRFGSNTPKGFKNSLRKVASLPILWAVIGGLFINLLGWSLPVFVVKILTPVSAANSALAMITLGVFVEFVFPKWKLMVLTVFLRMGIGFLLGQVIVLLGNFQGIERTIISMGAAMPIGMVPLVYANVEGLDSEFAAACISLSIVVGVIVSPLLLTIAS